MNDIKWHTQDQDNFWSLLINHKDSNIIVETNVTFRLSNTKYYNQFDGKMTDCDETLVRYAFYE